MTLTSTSTNSIFDVPFLSGATIILEYWAYGVGINKGRSGLVFAAWNETNEIVSTTPSHTFANFGATSSTLVWAASADTTNNLIKLIPRITIAGSETYNIYYSYKLLRIDQVS